MKHYKYITISEMHEHDTNQVISHVACMYCENVYSLWVINCIFVLHFVLKQQMIAKDFRKQKGLISKMFLIRNDHLLM